MRVLTIDGEQSSFETWHTALSGSGCLVQTAGSGREALRFLMQRDFDILVVSLENLEIDGFTFLEETLKIWPWLGVVIVSGDMNAEAARKAGRLGVTRVLRKPVGAQALCENVGEEARSRTREADTHPGIDPFRIRNCMRLLNGIVQKATRTNNLLQAIRVMISELADLMPSDVTGMLVIEEEPTQVLVSHAKVGRDSVLCVEREMLARYEALSGGPLDRDSIRLEIGGETTDSSGSISVGSILSVPIIEEQEIRGVLTLAAVPDEAYQPADVSLLCLVADYVSTMLVTLRRMRSLATRDSLTNVLNRIGLEQQLERTWLMSRRYGFSMGVLVTDIDNFKTLNDAFGHSVGDEILREFCRIIEKVLRASDIIARYGGDEFVVILPKTTDEDACALGERLLSSVRDHVFLESSHRQHVTVTIGISTSQNRTAPGTSAVVFSQADRAMYMGKRAGRDKLWLWPGRTVDKGGKEDLKAASGKGNGFTIESAKSQGRIMVVDDEPDILQLVKLMLEKDDHEVTTFTSAKRAVEEIRKHQEDYDILLTDLSIPGMSGIDLLHEVAFADSVTKIAMTGYATVSNAVKCLREGAYDFIQKPINVSVLSALIKRALEYHYLKRENALYQSHLEDMVKERSAQLAASLEEVRRSYEFTLEALVAMLDAREHQTGKHSVRTRELALTLAGCMGLGRDELEAIAHGALLHDIGKIGISDSILLSPGRLSAEEWKMMKKHPEIGYNILRASPYLKEAAGIVLAHHERYDGSGYPRGSRGSEICIGARIFAVVDAYDAMRSLRVYRESVSAEEAATEIRRNSGTQFDPEVVKAFLKCQDELEKQLSIDEPLERRRERA